MPRSVRKLDLEVTLFLFHSYLLLTEYKDRSEKAQAAFGREPQDETWTEWAHRVGANLRGPSAFATDSGTGPERVHDAPHASINAAPSFPTNVVDESVQRRDIAGGRAMDGGSTAEQGMPETRLSWRLEGRRRAHRVAIAYRFKVELGRDRDRNQGRAALKAGLVSRAHPGDAYDVLPDLVRAELRVRGSVANKFALALKDLAGQQAAFPWCTEWSLPISALEELMLGTSAPYY